MVTAIATTVAVVELAVLTEPIAVTFDPTRYKEVEGTFVTLQCDTDLLEVMVSLDVLRQSMSDNGFPSDSPASSLYDIQVTITMDRFFWWCTFPNPMEHFHA